MTTFQDLLEQLQAMTPEQLVKPAVWQSLPFDYYGSINSLSVAPTPIPDLLLGKNRVTLEHGHPVLNINLFE